MRLEQLEYLAAVSRHRSLRRAAADLHLSQPALSESIAKLERELGATLLHRDHAGTRLTTRGQELLAPVNAVLAAVEHLRDAARRLGPDTPTDDAGRPRT